MNTPPITATEIRDFIRNMNGGKATAIEVVVRFARDRELDAFIDGNLDKELDALGVTIITYANNVKEKTLYITDVTKVGV